MYLKQELGESNFKTSLVLYSLEYLYKILEKNINYYFIYNINDNDDKNRKYGEVKKPMLLWRAVAISFTVCV